MKKLLYKVLTFLLVVMGMPGVIIRPLSYISLEFCMEFSLLELNYDNATGAFLLHLCLLVSHQSRFLNSVLCLHKTELVLFLCSSSRSIGTSNNQKA